ncbi:hypothetical protein FAGAP_1437 [Fusarium agapanthi]|uniref:F-box domain-containing protein n=1 Tax=Fusarium agapanthi TaxID=1803897 RepID=A0A9P5EA97_9HYPO|nr:hypothetical protein FAGAP_1437 [Fusarium agapanthi]
MEQWAQYNEPTVKHHKHLPPEPYKDTAKSQTVAATAAWTVECLPNELLGAICDLLPNSDIKNLRLASPLLGQKCQLKISRVFISPNPVNIKVAMTIATYECYRLGVEEIIWDDATLVPSGGDGLLFHEYSEESEAEVPKEFAVEDQESFTWFARGCKSSMKAAKDLVVTPAAHGFLFEPLNRTPMIKSFPYGFIYPVPRGWPTPLPRNQWELAMPWVGDDAVEENKDLYHGFRIVTKVLAEEERNVTELMFDAHQLNTGVNHLALNRGSEEYNNFCDIQKRPGFQKLHLSLVVGFYLAEEYEICDEGHSWTIDIHKYTSLFDVFPIDRWQQLTHFGLSNVLVAQTDLIAFLLKLPQTVQTVELSFLNFMEGDGHYISLMEDIRDKLDWKHRPFERRIKTFAKIFCYLLYYGRYICIDNEVEECVYSNGPQPIQLRQRGNSSDVDPGTGVLKDLFNPAWERPNDYSTERRLVFPRQH